MANFCLFGSGKNKKETKKMTTKQQRKKRTTKNNLAYNKNARKRIYTYTRKYKIITNFNSKPLFRHSKTLLPTKWALVPTQQKYCLKSKISKKTRRLYKQDNMTWLFPYFLFSNFEFLIFRFSKFSFSDFRFLIFSGIRICTKPLGVLYAPPPHHPPQRKRTPTDHGRGFFV